MIFILFPVRSWAQAAPSAPDFSAIADYYNESIHLLTSLRQGVIDYNRHINQWEAGIRKEYPVFDPQAILRNPAYFTYLRASCAGGDAHGLSMDYLGNLSRSARHQASQWSGLNRPVDNLTRTNEAIWKTCTDLANISADKNQPAESIYQQLELLASHYDQVAFIGEELNTLIASRTANPGHQMDRLANLGRATISHFRNGQRRQLLSALERLDTALARQVRSDGAEESVAWEQFLGYLFNISQKAHKYLEQRQDAEKGEDCTYASEALISEFNHRKYGLAGFARQLNFLGQPMIGNLIEVAPCYRVVYPERRTNRQPGQSLATRNLNRLSGNRLPRHMVFVVDISASMRKPEKLGLLKTSLARLTRYMLPADRASLIIFSGESKIVFEDASPVDRQAILEAVSSLQANGRTRIKPALKDAYEVGWEHFLPEGANQIILTTDQSLRPGRRVRQIVKKGREKDIYLSILALGQGLDEKTLQEMRLLSQLGGGKLWQPGRNGGSPEIVEDFLLSTSARRATP